MRLFSAFLTFFLPLLTTLPAVASDGVAPPDSGVIGWIALGLFLLAYGLVLTEEVTRLRKSKPVTIAAGLIWIVVMISYAIEDRAAEGVILLRHTLTEFAELMLFLLSAMTYINTIEERGIFNALRARLVSQGFSLHTLFWICGAIAFFLSPIADNLTTALVMGAVVMAVGHDHPKFVIASFTSVVVAANAGGAFSPFGDITTLMVWQKGVVPFGDFFALFWPSLISWLIPAYALSLTVPKSKPSGVNVTARIKKGGRAIVGLFLFTVFLTVLLHQTLHIPPFLGMMTGLGLLKLYGYTLRRHDMHNHAQVVTDAPEKPFDIFVNLSRIEWDTMMFFYGVMLCVGGLGALGYLSATAHVLYGNFGDTLAHVSIGLLSAIIDNIPVMFAVLNMGIDHSLGQWLLVTLTAGIGGSLLSIGSAAGVALMGQARSTYTFAAHLKWTWVIALGYLAGIGAHLVINKGMF